MSNGQIHTNHVENQMTCESCGHSVWSHGIHLDKGLKGWKCTVKDCDCILYKE